MVGGFNVNSLKVLHKELAVGWRKCVHLVGKKVYQYSGNIVVAFQLWANPKIRPQITQLWNLKDQSTFYYLGVLTVLRVLHAITIARNSFMLRYPHVTRIITSIRTTKSIFHKSYTRYLFPFTQIPYSVIEQLYKLQHNYPSVLFLDDPVPYFYLVVL